MNVEPFSRLKKGMPIGEKQMTLLKSDHKYLRGQESRRPPADFGVKNIPVMYFCSKPGENVHK